MIINPDYISNIIIDVANKHIVPRFNLLQKSEINSKSSPNDLVTIADIESEKALDKILTEKFPESVLIGEESISAGEKSVDILREGHPMVWLTDPVDGTYNFVHGRPEFALMLACIINGETQYSWIYDIPGKRMMVAEKGAGAFIGGERLKVSAPKSMAESDGFLGVRYYPKEIRPFLQDFEPKVKSMLTLGCSGHEYLQMTAGQRDFCVSPRCRVWDHIPGALAFQEAGGIITQWDGSEYTPTDDMCNLIAASNEELHHMLRLKLVDPMLLMKESARMRMS